MPNSTDALTGPASRRRFLKASGAACATGILAAGTPSSAQPAKAVHAKAAPAAEGKQNPRRLFSTDRQDGRFVSTTAFLHAYMKNLRPKLAFDPEMKPNDFPAWREAVRTKLRELMGFPDLDEPQPPPKRLWTKQRDGYQLQKWEAYPEPYSVAPYLMLIPDGVSARSPAPAALCFPGSASSKESLAGELEISGKPCSHRHASRNDMARQYTRKGIVTVAVENPGTNETADPIRTGRYELSINGMWAGRHYEGISVFQKLHVLEWLKQQSYVDPDRIAASGHSLGAKPALILGVLDPTIKAVVWNDGITNWRERAVATNLERIGSFQYVPGMLAWLDYPDLEASLAPRPFLVSEGGRTAVLDRIRQAYRLLGAADQFKVVHYPKYATPDKRPFDGKDLPEGLTMNEYYPYANCDPPMHHFKGNVAVPWLAKVLGA